MKKKITIIILILILTVSCSDSNDENNQEVFLGEILFDFSLQNSEGLDLLDSSIEGTFNTSSILLYEKINGYYVLFDDQDSAHPDGYTIDTRNGINYFNPYYFDTGASTHDFKIDWGNGVVDFIAVTCEDGDGNWKVANEIKYNNELVWNRTINPDGLYFTVIVD